MSKRIEKILVPTDGSDGAMAAAAFAAEIARGVDAKVTVLTVNDDSILDITTPGIWSVQAIESGVTIDEIKELTEKNVAETILEPASKVLGNAVRFDTKQLWGHPSKTICDFAEQSEFDLIVIGSRGLSKFNRIVLGSVSSQVVSYATVPVTVVR